MIFSADTRVKVANAGQRRIPGDNAFSMPLSFAKLRPFWLWNVTLVHASTHLAYFVLSDLSTFACSSKRSTDLFSAVRTIGPGRRWGEIQIILVPNLKFPIILLCHSVRSTKSNDTSECA